jgi:cytochrome c biogenesis protein CcmG/thiol:disulfide interchange protein DsbE
MVRPHYYDTGRINQSIFGQETNGETPVIRRLLPLFIFLLLLGFLFQSLYNKDTELPSPLIGKPIPAFNLKNLITEEEHSSHEIIGEVSLINVWATWCVGCEMEHEFLVDLSQDKRIDLPIIGLNWKDDDRLAKLWLKQLGDPYSIVLKDPKGKAAIDFGVYGAPETFLVDSSGIIHFKHIGPLNREIFERDILPLIGELN